jgi:hypothetical protein
MNNVIIDKVNGVKISTGGSPTPVLSELDEALNAAGSYIVCTYKSYDYSGNEYSVEPYIWHLASSSDIEEFYSSEFNQTDAASYLDKVYSKVGYWGGYNTIEFTANKTGTLSFDILTSDSYKKLNVYINGVANSFTTQEEDGRHFIITTITNSVNNGDTVKIYIQANLRGSGGAPVAIKNLQIL